MAKPHKRKGFIAQFGSLVGVEEVAENLGHMTAAWSFLENQLALTLKHLTGIGEEDAFAIMYAQNATSSRLAVIEQLLRRLPGDDQFKADCAPIVKASIALTSRRNSLTHHLWVVDRRKGKAYTFDYRAPPGSQARRTTQTAKSVLQFTNEILANCREYAVLLGQEKP